jgi:hypothetical protein
MRRDISAVPAVEAWTPLGGTRQVSTQTSMPTRPSSWVGASFLPSALVRHTADATRVLIAFAATPFHSGQPLLLLHYMQRQSMCVCVCVCDSAAEFLVFHFREKETAAQNTRQLVTAQHLMCFTLAQPAAALHSGRRKNRTEHQNNMYVRYATLQGRCHGGGGGHLLIPNNGSLRRYEQEQLHSPRRKQQQPKR